jgi:beta-lactamase class A
MKVAVLAALYRADEAGSLALDTPVTVRNDFASAAPEAPKALAGADSDKLHRPRFGCDREYDSDREVWDRMGETVPLRWLAHRMIVRSGNLATNLVLSYVGLPAVAEVWRLAGARHSVTGRGIEDYAARDAGITNLVTAADLAALLSAIVTGTIMGADGCRQMLDVLLAQEHREDLAAGLPPGTRLAHKSGWVHGVRHGASVVFPDDAPPYALVVCTTTGLATGEDRDDPACRLLARIAAASWADRHDY